MRTSPRAVTLTALSALAVMLMACSPGTGSASASASASASSSASGSETAACTPDSMQTKTPGTFTVGTDNPNFPPYFAEADNPPDPWDGFDPTSGRGFESAVAYAVADELGYAKAQVTWVAVTFNQAIAPGPKDFDVYISQVSYTPERTQAVDLSEGYWFSNQALVTEAGSPLADATTVAEVAQHRLGAAANTTSLTYLQDTIKPSQEPRIYDDYTGVKSGLQSGDIEGGIFDLATAFYIAGVEMDHGVVVGQFSSDPADKEHFSFALDLDSPLTTCVDQAIRTMGENGELDEIAAKWMKDYVNAPFIR